MSQYCVMMFGVLCLMQAIFDLISLLSVVNGRTAEHTTSKTVADNKVTYTTVVETHPLFDEALGWHYNFQSAMKIATPVAMLLGAMLCKASYNHFPTSRKPASR